MTKTREFNFKKSRSVTAEEVKEARKAIEAKLGVKRPPRGRPPRAVSEKYQPIFIRMHPKAIRWAKSQAKRRRIGYQTFINETLLHMAA